MHNSALEFHHRAADLVTKSGLALLVVNLPSEETSTAGGGGGSRSCGAVITVRHFDFFFFVCIDGGWVV